MRRGALHRLAERYLDRGDVTLGLQAADEALAETPPAAEADEIELVKGELLSKAGRGDEAEALYEGIIASASSNDMRCRALNELGRAVAKRGDIDNGIAKLEQGLALNNIDENPHTRLSLHSGLIRSLGNANRMEQKGLAVKRMRDEFSERINAYDVDIHFCNILKYTAARQEALERMGQTIYDSPSATNADRDLFVLGREYRKDNNTDKTIEVYSYYIQNYPGVTVL
ncbi:tetratricopeptide repeat protein [bacterium]|nr:tetratricopeptide repeat protein [bacterium]